jgi:hypothetical protein
MDPHFADGEPAIVPAVPLSISSGQEPGAEPRTSKGEGPGKRPRGRPKGWLKDKPAEAKVPKRERVPASQPVRGSEAEQDDQGAGTSRHAATRGGRPRKPASSHGSEVGSMSPPDLPGKWSGVIAATPETPETTVEVNNVSVRLTGHSPAQIALPDFLGPGPPGVVKRS